MSSVVFFINQTRHQLGVGGRHTHQTLLEYLRDECFLKGSKQGCSEGGCGACTNMVSRWENNGVVSHRSVNACITPILSLDGCLVTTVEGVGDQKKLHPVQERIATMHGSQCGFCTPGFVMSLYTSLHNNATTGAALEWSFEGNLCRCTGYRPLLDAAKSFATDIEECYSPCPQRNPDGFCSTTKQKCTNARKVTDNIPEVVFPEELKARAFCRTEIADRDGVWLQPSSLAELTEIVNALEHCLIVGGNAGYRRVTRSRYNEAGAVPHIVWPARVAELRVLRLSDDGSSLRVGTATTLTEVEEWIRNGHDGASFAALRQALTQFGGIQIRNTTSIGGHVLSKPSGDLLSVLLAMRTTVTTNTVTDVLLEDFLVTPKPPKMIMIEFAIPVPALGTRVAVHKVAARRDNSVGIVTGAMSITRVGGAGGPVTAASFYLTGLHYNPLHCRRACAVVVEGGGDPLPVLAAEMAAFQIPLVESNDVFRRAAALGIFHRLLTQLMSTVPVTVGANFYDEGGIVSAGMQEWERAKGGLLTARPKLAPSDETIREPVGEPIMCITALPQVTGEAIYVDDIPTPAGCLHAALVKSTRAHAKIVSTDESDALRVPGVLGYYDSRHLCAREKAVKITAEKVFACGEVTCIGMTIGVIIATDVETAERAATMVRFIYEDLPALFTIQDAIAANSFFEFGNVVVDGDPDAAFADPTSVVISGEFNTGGQEHFYMEPHALLAVPGEVGDMEILSCTQCTTKTQSLVAGCLGIPRSKVNVRVKRIGGAFGGKEVRSTYTSGVIAIAASILKRPVRWLISREEDMLITGGRHPYHSKWSAALSPDGLSLRAISVDMYSNGGCTTSATEEVMKRALMHITNAYKIPNVTVRGFLCHTNLPSNTAFRGFGAPQAMSVMENIMEAASFRMKTPIETLRMSHLFPKATRTHYGQLVEHSHLTRMWGEVMASADYVNRKESVAAFNKTSRLVKRGIAIVPTMYGINFPLRYLNQAGALIVCYCDGTVVISHSAVEMGQGINTKMAQIAARAFGIAVSSIHVADCSVDKVPNTPPTAASVGADLNGMAVLDGCEQIIERLKPLREKYPKALFSELCEHAFKARVSLSAEGFYSTDKGAAYDWKMDTKDNAKRGDVFNYYSFGVACAEVEIDVLSGMHRIRFADLLMDCGDTLNAAIDIGQVESSWIQGQGWFTTEELIWGDSSHPLVPPGHLHNASPHGYKIPGPMDVALDLRVRLLSGAPNPMAVHSSKAVGEPPFFLAASVFFALKDAIYAAREDEGLTGYLRVDSPLTVERIRMACRDRLTALATGNDKEDYVVQGSF